MKRWILGGVAGLLAAAALAVWHRASSSSFPSIPAFPFVWKEEESAYRLRVVSRTVPGEGGRSSGLTVELTALLYIRPFKNGDTLQVGFSLRNPAVRVDNRRSPRFEKNMARPFIVTMTPSGRVLSVQFSPAVDDVAEGILTNLVYCLESVVSAGGKSTYLVRQRDALGVALVKYTRRADGFFIKRKLEYLNPRSGSDDTSSPPSDITVLYSRFRFRPGKAETWLDVLSGGELVRVRIAGGAYVSSTETRVSLERSPGSPPGPFTRIHSLGVLRAEVARVPRADLPPAAEASVPSPGGTSPGVSLDPVIGELISGAGREASLRLRALLRADPSLALDIPARLRSGMLEDTAVAELINVLGLVGTPEAQKALVAIASDSGFSERDRFRAVISLESLSSPPSEETLEYLFGAFDLIRHDPDLPERVTSSILVAGAIAGNLRETYPDAARAIRVRLLRLLERAAVPEQRSCVITALGNTRDPDNVAVLRNYAASPEPPVRYAVLNALGKIRCPESAAVLTAQLKSGEEEEVLSEVLRNLYDQPLSREQLAPVELLLLSSPSSEVRRRALRILVKNAPLDPAGVQAVLEAAREKETCPDNMRIILKHLGVSRRRRDRGERGEKN